MKKITYKILSLVFSMAIIITSSILPVSANINATTENNPNVSESVKDSTSPDTIKDSGKTARYISKEDAVLLAIHCIKEEVETGDHCCWNKSTKISEMVDLFDFEGNINAYLFRLTTNGKRTGYVFVNAYAKSPSVGAFGYDCDFILDSWQISNGKGRASTNNHIIFDGGLAFLNQNKSSGNYFLIGNNYKKVDAIKSDLIKNYKNKLQSKVNIKAQANLVSLKANLLNGFIVTSNNSSHDLSGIWSSGYTIYISEDFHQINNCAPTAATNLVYYWAHYGNPKQPRLWTGRVHDDLAKYMNYETQWGTFNSDILPGIEQFASSRNAPINQKYDDGNYWFTLTDRLDSNYPVIVCIQNDPEYGGQGKGHAMLAVGYKEKKDSQYIRVADGMKRTFNNFYQYSDYVIGEYSVSW